MTARRRPAPRGAIGYRWGAGLLCLAAALLLLLYLAPELQGRSNLLAMAAAFVPYGVLAWALALVLVLLGTRGHARAWVIPVALGLVGHSVVLLPYLPTVRTAADGTPPELTVLTLNLRFGLADLTELEDVVARERPDVVVLTEVSRRVALASAEGSWRELLPYRAGRAGADFDAATGAGDPRGTMVLSRLPLTELGYTERTRFTNLAVRLETAEGPVFLVAAHPVNPATTVKLWLRDGQAVASLAATHAAQPLIVAGDLNATAEHLTLRCLLSRAGLANTSAGQGWQPTYPANRWYPPLIAIDHVLASRHFTVTGYRTVQVPGTDHLGVLVRLARA